MKNMMLTLSFTEILHSWYKKHARALPWRNISDPYKIWVSETILQQTRISQGLPYYKCFIERFPNIAELAAADSDEVMKYWEGLGYYTRIRNMHEAAKNIVLEHNGKFPGSYDAVRKLKGIGDYTAAAIVSIAFGMPYAAIDGNVLRVIARCFGIEEAINTSATKKKINRLATELLDVENPGIHNQAMMELGALVCKPQNPDCELCPIKNVCRAYINNMVKQLPFKNKPQPRKIRYFIFLVIRCGQTFAIEKREEPDIWKNLYQFPLVETEMLPDCEEVVHLPGMWEILQNSGAVITGISRIYQHELTHRRIIARFVHVNTETKPTRGERIIWINTEDFSTFAFPALIKNYLQECNFS